MPRKLTHLPIAADGTAGLQKLADAYGDLNTLKCILWIRDPRIGCKTVTPFRDALAVAITYDEGGGDLDAARAAAARTLGYPPRRVQNFYRYVTAGLKGEAIDVEPEHKTRLTHLPTEEDGIEGLRRLVGTFGKVNVLQFILFLRDGTNHAVSRFRGRLALRLVDAEMAADPTLDFAAARALAARKAGFTGLAALPNFHRYVEDGLEATHRTAA